MTSLSFFGFLVNLEQSEGRIPDTEYEKVMLSEMVTFCLTITTNKTKKSLTQLSHCCFEDFFGQETQIFCKKMLASANIREPRH